MCKRVLKGVLDGACLKTFDQIMLFEQSEILLDILSLKDSRIPRPQWNVLFILCIFVYMPMFICCFSLQRTICNISCLS